MQIKYLPLFNTIIEAILATFENFGKSCQCDYFWAHYECLVLDRRLSTYVVDSVPLLI